MPYKHGEYILHRIDVNFKAIGKRPMYFFSKKISDKGTPCDMPDGYEVIVNKRTGLPLLKYSGDKVSLHQRKKAMKQK